MLNNIELKGTLRDIQHSHTIGDVEYEQAELLVPRDKGKEDTITIKYKKFSNKYKENDCIEIKGNLRSYSHKVNNKNKVDLYVFTYFDEPETILDEENSTLNKVTIEGRICKKQDIRELANGKNNIRFILANNISNGNTDRRLNSYIPCIAWGQLAKDISKYDVGTAIKIIGSLQSREYKKYIGEDLEIRVAHELVVKEVTLL